MPIKENLEEMVTSLAQQGFKVETMAKPDRRDSKERLNRTYFHETHKNTTLRLNIMIKKLDTQNANSNKTRRHF